MATTALDPTRGKPAVPDTDSGSLMTEPSRDALKVDSVTVRPAENGGYIVTCSKSRRNADGRMVEPGGGYESKDYAFGNLADVHSYLEQELAGANPGAASPYAPPPTAPVS